jgi:hypothetical protein
VVPRLLAERPAVVLERIARGGGATHWFHARSLQDLEPLSARLSPGSVVSFYFDDRIALRPYDDETIIRILDLAATSGDAVVGRKYADDLEIFVEFVAGANELGDFADGLTPGSQVFVGAFPAADSDDQDAVTFTLPDRDGEIRRHPH